MIGILLLNMINDFSLESDNEVIIVTIVSTIITVIYCYETFTSFLQCRDLYGFLLKRFAPSAGPTRLGEPNFVAQKKSPKIRTPSGKNQMAYSCYFISIKINQEHLRALTRLGPMARRILESFIITHHQSS